MLEKITIPNILLNHYAPDQGGTDFEEIEISWDRMDQVPRLGRCYYGDWSELPYLLEEKSYDIILAAETIFSPLSYRKHADVILRGLRRHPDAVVLIACKSYYFGCGGSVKDFRQYLESRIGGERLITKVEAIFGGEHGGVRREIISIRIQQGKDFETNNIKHVF